LLFVLWPNMSWNVAWFIDKIFLHEPEIKDTSRKFLLGPGNSAAQREGPVVLEDAHTFSVVVSLGPPALPPQLA
jgi:hypothetical protein